LQTSPGSTSPFLELAPADGAESDPAAVETSQEETNLSTKVILSTSLMSIVKEVL